MTKTDIVDYIVGKLNSGEAKKESSLNKKRVGELVDLMFDAMVESVKKGEDIKISGFGNFVIQEKKSRPGRNPKTGENITIAARRALTFRSSQLLKGALNSK